MAEQQSFDRRRFLMDSVRVAGVVTLGHRSGFPGGIQGPCHGNALADRSGQMRRLRQVRHELRVG